MLGRCEIEAGKDSMWWGPGYHGSILMSNNAEPFKMLKLSTPSPVSLPWIFKALGPFKVVWFLTQLEDDRPVPEPLADWDAVELQAASGGRAGGVAHDDFRRRRPGYIQPS